MKFQSVLTSVLLGTAALVISAAPSRAALTYNPGDLFLGFHEGATASYLINIGNFSLYSQQNGASFTVNTGGNIVLDLNTTFTPNWKNAGTVSWGVVGTSFSNIPDLNVIYASKQRTNPAVRSTPLISESNSGQTAWRSDIVALSNKYKLDGDSTGLNSTKATVQDGGDVGSNTYASFTKTSVDFGIANLEGQFTVTAGTSGSVLDLYRLDPGFGQNGAYLGSFSINDNGVVTFTAVPEPGVVALLGLGALVLILRLRRRSSPNLG